MPDPPQSVQVARAIRAERARRASVLLGIKDMSADRRVEGLRDIYAKEPRVRFHVINDELAVFHDREFAVPLPIILNASYIEETMKGPEKMSILKKDRNSARTPGTLVPTTEPPPPGPPTAWERILDDDDD